VENIKKIENLLEESKSAEKKIGNFSDILNSLPNTDGSKKSLWKEIYENSVSDRERASILFTEAFKSMTGSASDHIALGTTMVKYLERMCKSNDQILSLADLINKAQSVEAEVNPDDLFSKISGDN
jgi:hypothetical protein